MRRLAHTVVAVVIMSATFQNAALAGPPADHGDRQPEPFTPQMQRIHEQKDKLLREFVSIRGSGGSFDLFEIRFAAFRASVGERPRPLRFTPPTRPGSVTTQSHVYGMTLSTLQTPQINSYYCGPGAGYPLLNFLGHSTSAYNGAHALSQSNLARTEYFRTDAYGNTPWYTYGGDPDGAWPVPAGLNRWRVGSITGYYEPIAYPTDVAVYQERLNFDIHGGYPLMGNTVEVLNGSRYNGHPAGAQIEHWIVLDGYADYGNQTNYTDPAANASSLNWTNTLAYHWAYSSTMLSTYLTHRGYVW